MAQVQLDSQRKFNWARVLLTGLSSILILGLVGWDEVALGAPIIFFVETLGFGAGLVVFIITWMILGLAMLAFADFAWPSLKPLWKLISEWAQRMWKRYANFISVVAVLPLIPAIYVGVRYHLLFTAIAIAAVVFVGCMEVIRQVSDRWVRSIDPRKGRRLRWIGALVAVVILGPVFAWTLLKWLEFSRASVYGFTAPAAVVFGIIWVPYYSLGVWRLLNLVL